MSEQKPLLKKRTGLGRGLGALLNDSVEAESPVVGTSPLPEPAQPAANINEIPVSAIETNPFQPRTDFEQVALEELAESIRVQGIIQPITVRELGPGQYQLISGERRLQASKLAGLSRIPAYIRTANEQQMLEMALIENIQRENLNAMEVALSYQRLITEIGIKQEELGDRVGKKRTTVNNYLRLLKLPPEIQTGLRDKKIDMGHARALVNVENVEDQLALYRQAVEQGLSVRKVEELVRKLSETSTPPAEKTPSNPTLEELEMLKVQNRLASHFGTKVLIKSSDAEKGEIRIPFLSPQDLNRILELLNL